MEVYCTRPTCPRPANFFPDLDNSATLKTIQQKFCTTCGMPLMLAGRYVPLKLLGKGGFGAAFLARDRYTPAMRQCVVKQFLPSGDLTPNQLKTAQELFEREATVLEELGKDHPQIPDLLAFFELDVPDARGGGSNKFFYIVQEFIDGQNLEDEVAQKGPFSEAEVLHVLREMLKVLDYVHTNGSIHRDIKPSNIMRRRDGRLYLLDFGAVKQATSKAAVSGGKASTGIYSMGFAPPEQMAGNTVYPATDLYALAVTCLTLLTGKEPNQLYDSYSNSWNWRAYANVSDRLEAILNRMLLPSPSQRFQSAPETLDALALTTVNSPGVPTSSPQPALTNPQPTAAPPPSTSLQPASPNPPPLPIPSPSSPAVPGSPSQPPFSLLEWIGAAAFTGFEGGLLAIALLSFLGTTLVGAGAWIVLLAVLILSQSRRWLEGKDLPILAGLTTGVVLLILRFARFSVLPAGNALPHLIVVAGLTALAFVAIALVFRLIYKLISNVL